MKTLSIITINLNNIEGLKKTIDSVESIASSEIEYLIIDGGSQDGFTELMNEKTSIVNYYLSEPDKGIYDAMNKGLSLAKGRYLIFLNSGDCIYDSILFKQNLEILKSQHCDAIYYGNSFLLQSGKTKIEPDALSLSFWDTSNLCHQAIFFPKTAFDHYGKYNLQYPIASDFERNIRFYINGVPFIKIRSDFPIVSYDETGVSSTNLARLKIDISEIKTQHKEIFELIYKYFNSIIQLFY
jgi:glycosyltransferase involved in cell wall biosynthesis